MALKITTCNLRGLGNKNKRLSIFQALKNLKADIILVQELHSTEAIEKTWSSNWGNTILFSHGTNKSAGAGILFGSNIEYKNYQNVIPGRCQIINININNKQIAICNVYAPNKDTEQIEFYKNVLREMT